MRVYLIPVTVCLTLLLTLVLAFTTKDSPKSQGESCRKLITGNIESILAELNASKTILAGCTEDEQCRQKLIQPYHRARKYYKEIEFFVEYYSPFETKFYINGPLVPKVEMEISSMPFLPQGFQVIEEAVFNAGKMDPSALNKEYDLLIEKFGLLNKHYATLSIESNKLFESLKLQLIRIMCLTLNGYDCTINKEAITECAYSLEGIEKTLLLFSNAQTKNDVKLVLKRIKKAKHMLITHPDSDRFDRLNFIRSYLHPLYSALVKFGNSSNVTPSLLNYAANLNTTSFFELNSINKQYFSVYISDTLLLDKQAELGKLLFYDPILSGNNRRACASCHQANKGFTDGANKSLAYDGVSRIGRNAPTLINAAYQKLYFHDGRIFNLEEQAAQVFNNAFEMNTSQAEIISKLKQSEEYRQLFKEAFRNKPDTNLTFYAVIKSITEFIKTLDSRGSRFDSYLRGNNKALNKDEKNGFNLFAGKALCASCHFFPLFNGTVPPMYNDNEFETLGVPESENSRIIDSDVGREKISKSQTQRFAFKTPTLRNIELTGPYMHNGIYSTLDSVIAFYNKGGGVGLGMNLTNQTLPFDSLGLTKKEMNNIKQFLISLTDTSFLPKPPKRLPQFKNESWNKRKVGGEY